MKKQGEDLRFWKVMKKANVKKEYYAEIFKRFFM